MISIIIIPLFFKKKVLKYAAEYLDLSEEDMMYVPVDDFDDGVEGMCLFFYMKQSYSTNPNCSQIARHPSQVMKTI